MNNRQDSETVVCLHDFSIVFQRVKSAQGGMIQNHLIRLLLTTITSLLTFFLQENSMPNSQRKDF